MPCSVAELDAAVAAGASVIGVNNRNLRSFTLDMGTTAAVVARAASLSIASGAQPSRNPIVLSLSGIKEAADITMTVVDCARAAAAIPGAAVPRGRRLGETLRGFLIGEALMRATDPAGMVRTSTSVTH